VHWYIHSALALRDDVIERMQPLFIQGFYQA
jgi:hypothetical protein